MNKTAIKNFAVWAHNKLISEIYYKAGLLGITKAGIAEELSVSTANLKFYDIGTKEPVKVEGTQIKQRDNLVKEIRRKVGKQKFEDAFENFVEEVAYTWFNRLIAIRFMEVNDYLPSGVRVLSSDIAGKNEPDMVTNPFDTDIDFTDAERESMLSMKSDELFRFLFIKQCNQLWNYLPKLFERTDSYSELLIPLSYTDTDSVVYHLVHDIPEEDFDISKEGQVQILGWLYQYYNSEAKDKVFADLKKNIKITAETIPAATQLFTPDWIVRYMVENSLGRLWIDGHADFDKSEWKYYLEEAEQEEAVKAELEKIRAEYKNISPEEIKFLDPCMGSGHILVYAFDVLMKIYLSCGYTEKSAASLIIQKNLYGLDIDKRAYQLAYFSLMMKGRQYDRNFLNRGIFPCLEHFQELNDMQNAIVPPKIGELIEQFKDCDTYGSLIELHEVEGLDEALEHFDGVIFFDAETCERVMTINKILTQKYDVVCTNPPYMATANAVNTLADFAKKSYPDSKTDCFAMFMERCGKLSKYYYAMITQHAWMFLSSYEKLREKLIFHTTINMAHLGARAFDEIGGEVVQTCAFVNIVKHLSEYIGIYARLVDVTGESNKKELFLSGEQRYNAVQDNFSKIPGAPVAYWVSVNFIKAFENKLISNYAFSDGQILTGNNDKYLRMLWEVEKSGIEDKSKWVLHAKGGEQRRWYGNIDTVVSWTPSSIHHYKTDKISRFPKDNILFRKGITWSLVSSSDMFSMRLLTEETTFNKAAATILFENNSLIPYFLAFLNTKITKMMLKTLNPTLNTNIKDILALPIIISSNTEIVHQIEDTVAKNISISKDDWDSFETSWDFKKHPLL